MFVPLLLTRFPEQELLIAGTRSLNGHDFSFGANVIQPPYRDDALAAALA